VAEAELLADAAHRIRAAGIPAEGEVRSAREEYVARCIVAGPAQDHCEAIVLGPLRLPGLHRLSGHGVRERVLKLSSLPVIVTPTALQARKRIPAS
jgi:nucleotide-binding universal stress UspA family protein